MTTSSVPVPALLLLPDGWPDSYGLDWVGHPVKRVELYSNHAAELTVGMIGSWVATYCSSGIRSWVWVGTVSSAASFCSSALTVGLLRRSKSPVALLPETSAGSSQ